MRWRTGPRKGVEADPPTAAAAGAPRAARVDPLHATARHKTLHHFVAKVQWSDWQLFHCVRQCVVALKDFCAGALWIIDDSGSPREARIQSACRSKTSTSWANGTPARWLSASQLPLKNAACRVQVPPENPRRT
ncbi:MAG: transposase [Comamonadaceae bacterium]|nr:transposase [Comamonadaceae bacterium]